MLPSSGISPPARNQAFDVVLVDTAGRMQDNAPLMTALAKLIAVNMPDLVLFVGEALVGNEAVDQLVRPPIHLEVCLVWIVHAQKLSSYCNNGLHTRSGLLCGKDCLV